MIYFISEYDKFVGDSNNFVNNISNPYRQEEEDLLKAEEAAGHQMHNASVWWEKLPGKDIV